METKPTTPEQRTFIDMVESVGGPVAASRVLGMTYRSVRNKVTGAQPVLSRDLVCLRVAIEEAQP